MDSFIFSAAKDVVLIFGDQTALLSSATIEHI